MEFMIAEVAAPHWRVYFLNMKIETNKIELIGSCSTLCEHVIHIETSPTVGEVTQFLDIFSNPRSSDEKWR